MRGGSVEMTKAECDEFFRQVRVGGIAATDASGRAPLAANIWCDIEGDGVIRGVTGRRLRPDDT